MKVEININPEEEAKRRTRFISETLKSRRFSRVVIGCSGGIDSSTTLLLAVRSIGRENVFAILMPYKNLNPNGLNDAVKMVKIVGLPKKNVEIIDISSLVDPFAKLLDVSSFNSALKVSSDTSKTTWFYKDAYETDLKRLGNIMARCRMIVLYDRAKKHKALVLGTENKSEYLLGYYTRFGDEASDIEPIRHLYKTQVYQLARYLGVPNKILEKKPTAGLWQGQTDEKEMGFNYRIADPVLHGLFEKRLTVEQLYKMGFNKKNVNKVKKRIESNRFKHELPVVKKVF